jgi:hypothetical protein
MKHHRRLHAVWEDKPISIKQQWLCIMNLSTAGQQRMMDIDWLFLS